MYYHAFLHLSFIITCSLILNRAHAFPFTSFNKRVALTKSSAQFGTSDSNNNNSDGNDDKPPPQKKRKKKMSFTINSDLTETEIKSPALLEKESQQDQKTSQTQHVKSKLGVPSRKKAVNKQNSNIRKPSNRVDKISKQRTANGTSDSRYQTAISNYESKIQIQEAKRGSKVVTIIRGLTIPMEERKTLLKELKSKFGGGGTLIDGVLELQGRHGSKILHILQTKGYSEVKLC